MHTRAVDGGEASRRRVVSFRHPNADTGDADGDQNKGKQESAERVDEIHRWQSSPLV
jgi:hypothetical protein